MNMASRRARIMTGQKARVKGQTAKPQRRNTAKLTKTCPVCAETFRASRSDQLYCSDLHRWYANKGIPKHILEEAAELRQSRTKTAAVRRETRRLNSDRKERDYLRQMLRMTECDGTCLTHHEWGPMYLEVQRLKAEKRYCG